MKSLWSCPSSDSDTGGEAEGPSPIASPGKNNSANLNVRANCQTGKFVRDAAWPSPEDWEPEGEPYLPLDSWRRPLLKILRDNTDRGRQRRELVTAAGCAGSNTLSRSLKAHDQKANNHPIMYNEALPWETCIKLNVQKCKHCGKRRCIQWHRWLKYWPCRAKHGVICMNAYRTKASTQRCMHAYMHTHRWTQKCTQACENAHRHTDRQTCRMHMCISLKL